MQTQTRPRTEPAPTRRRRNWGPALATAAIIAVVAIGIAIFALGGDDGEPAPPVTQPTEVTEAFADTVETREALARAAIADWNAHDVEGFFGRFADDGTVDGTPASDSTVALDLGFYMALGNTGSAIECGPVGDAMVLCSTTVTDDLSGPAGVTSTVTWSLAIVDNQIVSLEFGGPLNEAEPNTFSVIHAMTTDGWIRDNHPDVWETTFRATLDRCDATNYNFYGTWCASPAAAAEMLRLGPEYLADAGL